MVLGSKIGFSLTGASIALTKTHPLGSVVPSDGRRGWFEGVREGRLCGWTHLPSDPNRVLDVILSSSTSPTVTVRADYYRADLQAAGLADCYHGFSFPVEMLPGAQQFAECRWADLDAQLPGSPWTPAHRKKRVQKGAIRLVLDSPPAGDPRLSGSVYDMRHPLRRVKIGAKWEGDSPVLTVASLYRNSAWGETDDGFHGFVLPLPAPLRMLSQGIVIFDADHRQTLARLGPRSL